MKERLEELEDEVRKKITYINSLKGDEEHRIRAHKKEESDLEKLQKENRELREEVRKLRDDVDKVKKKKDREIGALEDELRGNKN